MVVVDGLGLILKVTEKSLIIHCFQHFWHWWKLKFMTDEPDSILCLNLDCWDNISLILP